MATVSKLASSTWHNRCRKPYLNANTRCKSCTRQRMTPNMVSQLTLAGFLQLLDILQLSNCSLVCLIERVGGQRKLEGFCSACLRSSHTTVGTPVRAFDSALGRKQCTQKPFRSDFRCNSTNTNFIYTVYYDRMLEVILTSSCILPHQRPTSDFWCTSHSVWFRVSYNEL